MSEEHRMVPMPPPADAGVGEPDVVPPSMDEIPVDVSPPEPLREGPTVVARRRPSVRIPDDEVVRPKLAAIDGPGRPAVVTPAPPWPQRQAPAEEQVAPRALQPMRIISIGPEPMAPDPSPLVPPDPPTEPTLGTAERSAPQAIAHPSTPPVRPSRPPILAIETEEVDVRFDDDVGPPTPRVLTPVIPAPSNDRADRRSDPGEEPEISPEDLVPIDPSPTRSVAALPPLVPRVAQRPAVTGPAPVMSHGRPPLVIVPPHVGSIPPQSAESGSGRRKARLWWEELFNDDHLRATEKVTDEQIDREADFIEESLGVERGGALLDLGCGTGRHAVELARRGYQVVGFDLSLAMLARAGEEAQERSIKLNFVQGDMREMAFEEQFDGVYCWNTSFGYFEEDKNSQVVDRVHRALKLGGLFLLDVVNRDFLVQQSPSLAWFEGDGCVCMDEMSVDFITSRMKVKRTMMLDDGRSREVEYSVRVYSLHELGKILHEHGFKVREVSGRLATPGVFFGSDSPRAIILAEKR